MSTKTIYLNQDDSAFTRCHALEDMTVEGLERLVDFYAQGQQLAGLAFCVNMQRALFNSHVWETIVCQEEPGSAGAKALSLRTGEAAGTAALLAHGIDHFAVWLKRARFHGIEAFLTMRMNDCHGLESHGGFGNEKGDDQDHYDGHATRFWKENPQLRRAPYRYERSFEGAFDYGKEEVRRHHLNLVAELFERYDMDGFEMDWMRWMFMFAPGGEAKGRDLLSGFISDVDRLRKAAEKRYGHAIQLRHRVPAEPQTCFALGYDVAAWAQHGLADQIILSCFGGAANFDYPIEAWRRQVGSGVRILALAEAVAGAYPGTQVENYHFSFGSASSALQRGADGIYLFNECYREAGGPEQRRLLLQMLNSMGSPETLNRLVRRHPVTYPQVHAPGEAPRVLLPIPLQNPVPGADAGRWADNISLRLNIGSKPERAKYVLRLGFSEDAPLDALQRMVVRVNTRPVTATLPPIYNDCMKEAYPDKFYAPLPSCVHHLLHYEVPAIDLQEDVNVVEFEPAAQTGRVEWAEMLVIPLNE